MLTADLAISFRRGNIITPRYLQLDDPRQLKTTADLKNIFERHLGLRRSELQQALDDYIGAGTDYKILRGLIKLLLDRCTFETVSAREPAEIRRAIFTRAAAQNAVTAGDQARQRVIDETAAELECEPDELVDGLYADLSGNQRLSAFEDLSEEELLDRYNLAQAQALLYRCSELMLWVEPQKPAVARRLFDEIKAFRLIHSIEGDPRSGYEVRLSGPVSIFHRSQKYGVQMAVFLPALLLCSGWRMRAEIGTKTGPAYFELDSRQNRLRSHYFGDEIRPDDPLSQKLLDDFNKMESGWIARSNQEVIDLGHSAFVPDFVFARDGGEPIYLEMLGYWTPRSLSDRLKEFDRAGFKNFAIAVSEEMRCSRDAPSKLPPNVIVYKKSLNARELHTRLVQLEKDRK